MKKAMQFMQKMYPALSIALVIVAAFGVKPASLWGLHQPRVPKCIK